MSIDEILKSLNMVKGSTAIRQVGTEFCSNRGYYEHLSMAPANDEMPVKEFMAVLKAQIGKTYYGYKGGEFTMAGHTQLFIANYGSCGKMVRGVGIDEEGAFLLLADRDFNGL
jgi:hypothetical protein